MWSTKNSIKNNLNSSSIELAGFDKFNVSSAKDMKLGIFLA